MAIALGLLAAVAYGASDFAAGLASRWLAAGPVSRVANLIGGDRAAHRGLRLRRAAHLLPAVAPADAIVLTRVSDSRRMTCPRGMRDTRAWSSTASAKAT